MISFEQGKTAPLNWCPECGNKLKETNLVLKDGTTGRCKQCQTCGYMHDLQFLNTAPTPIPGVSDDNPPTSDTPPQTIPPFVLDPNGNVDNGPAPLPEDDDENDTGFIPPVW